MTAWSGSEIQEQERFSGLLMSISISESSPFQDLHTKTNHEPSYARSEANAARLPSVERKGLTIRSILEVVALIESPCRCVCIRNA